MPLFLKALTQQPTLAPIPVASICKFLTFNGGSPLVLSQKNDILVAAIKAIPFFTRETFITPYEHIYDVASICMMFDVIEDNVATNLLGSSFKGKALQWYRHLFSGSIHNWDELGEKLSKHFEDKSDHLSLVEQLTTIKKSSHAFMGNFNYRFQKTWDRIPTLFKPSSNHAFLYFLRALNSDIVVIIQSIGGDNRPRAYDTAIRAKNFLIQDGKLPRRPPMPLFVEDPTQHPTLAPIPVASTYKFLTPAPTALYLEFKEL